jgi:hypothetical protein
MSEFASIADNFKKKKEENKNWQKNNKLYRMVWNGRVNIRKKYCYVCGVYVFKHCIESHTNSLKHLNGKMLLYITRKDKVKFNRVIKKIKSKLG